MSPLQHGSTLLQHRARLERELDAARSLACWPGLVAQATRLAPSLGPVFLTGGPRAFLDAYETSTDRAALVQVLLRLYHGEDRTVPERQLLVALLWLLLWPALEAQYRRFLGRRGGTRTPQEAFSAVSFAFLEQLARPGAPELRAPIVSLVRSTWRDARESLRPAREVSVESFVAPHSVGQSKDSYDIANEAAGRTDTDQPVRLEVRIDAARVLGHLRGASAAEHLVARVVLGEDWTELAAEQGRPGATGAQAIRRGALALVDRIRAELSDPVSDRAGPGALSDRGCC